ncbi:MAG: thioredoxin domain-containing protein [Bacteroidia bacterium]|nr:thioredoxin domain-containing protein [Bacteroidia bacterium]MBP7260427.1 thioredoxin domain-containing protein [Bacteroidia bacterium]MBP9179755.1 thioredoxin domain-containing protein [Bacteroidia bacterium]MBP9724112.1 thioredoxin domain-containing protein [Bacteroidia bacterium]
MNYLCYNMQHKYTNRLIDAASPYLLQHAHNPVNWFPWGEEAFDKAKREDKLVLVSIGYSACHWCHVMEHESFEDEEVADVMNQRFVCIKVDREERPDVDQIYMDAVQLITGRGGWPLNMFVLPDGKPLHGGTYFPKENWVETLIALDNFYKNKKTEAIEFAEKLTGSIQRMDALPVATNNQSISIETVKQYVDSFKEKFDRVFGGYNWAPKFPMPNNHLFFLHYSIRMKDDDVKQAAFTTLTKMAEGGIYDQSGGGFARYSTDHYWKVPHFEKMLYDNGQLLSLYASAFKEKQNPLFKHVIYQTAEWLTREMTDGNGAFYSSLDADSEGVEGKFYIWSKEELQQLLGEDEPFFSLYYNIQPQGNWEHGLNILYKTLPDHELLSLTGKTKDELTATMQRCHTLLLAAREKRIRPGLDDKIVTSWNALTITGLVDCYRATADELFLNMAERNVAYLMSNHYVNGKLYRIGKSGKVSVDAFSEDYAYLIEALIQLHTVNGNSTYLHQAKQLMEECISLFYDKDSELFFFNSHSGEQLITRKRDITDDVTPSSNSVLAKSLYQLSYFFGEPAKKEMAEKMIQAVQPKIGQYINGYANWLDLMLWMSAPYYQLVLTGKNAHSASIELAQKSLPHFIYTIAGGEMQGEIPLTAGKNKTGENLRVYVCVDQTCMPAVSTLGEALLKMLF